MKKWMVSMAIALVSLMATASMSLAQGTLDRDSAVQIFEKGREAAAREDYATALAQFERAKENGDVAPLAWLYIAMIQDETKGAQAAVESYLTAAGYHGNGVARESALEWLSRYGYELLAKKDYAAAEKVFTPGVWFGPGLLFADRTRPLYGMSVALLEQGRANEAADLVEKLILIAPMDLKAYILLYHAYTRSAQALAQDLANQQRAQWRYEQAKDIEARANALPVLVDDIKLVREGGRVIVRASVTGNSAPAGHSCIVGYTLIGAPNAAAAGATFIAPARGEKLIVDALAPRAEQDQAFADIHYRQIHCEAPGAATVSPPDAKPANLAACPENPAEAYALLQGREAYGSILDDDGDNDHVHPAGGIKIFTKPITRLVTHEGSSLYEFGLPGAFRDYSSRFRKIYADRTPRCGDNFCSAVSHDGRVRLVAADLIDQATPEGLFGKGVKLTCLYQ